MSFPPPLHELTDRYLLVPHINSYCANCLQEAMLDVVGDVLMMPR